MLQQEMWFHEARFVVINFREYLDFEKYLQFVINVLCKRKVTSSKTTIYRKSGLTNVSGGGGSLDNIGSFSWWHTYSHLNGACYDKNGYFTLHPVASREPVFCERRWLRRTAFIREQQIDILRPSCAPFIAYLF